MMMSSRHLLMTSSSSLSVLLAGLLLVGYVVGEPLASSAKALATAEEKSGGATGSDLGKRDWTGMKAAWGKRAGDDDEVEDYNAAVGDSDQLPERQRRGPSSSWQTGLGAWGKKRGAGDGGWGQNLRAWGKRTPAEWNSEYMQTLQRQMEAVKNRRASNWQLASWGRRRR